MELELLWRQVNNFFFSFYTIVSIGHSALHMFYHPYLSHTRSLFVYIYIYIYVCVCVCVCMQVVILYALILHWFKAEEPASETLTLYSPHILQPDPRQKNQGLMLWPYAYGTDITLWSKVKSRVTTLIYENRWSLTYVCQWLTMAQLAGAAEYTNWISAKG